MAVDLKVGTPHAARPEPSPSLGAGSRPPPPTGRTRGGPLLLPPWTRAFRLGLGQPAVFLAVVGATAILACAAASPSLFLSSSASKALQRLIAAECPDSAYPAIRSAPQSQYVTGESATAIRAQDRAVRRAVAAAGLPGPNVMMISYGGELTDRGPAGLQPLTAYGTHTLDHIQKLRGLPGARGVWISDEAARYGHTRLGGTVRLNQVPVRVVGIYRDLKTVPIPGFWCSYKPQFLPRSIDDDNLIPKVTIATDLPTWLRLAANPPQPPPPPPGRYPQRYPLPPVIDWLAPIHTDHLRVDQAKVIDAKTADAVRRLGPARAAAARERMDLLTQAGVGNQHKLPQMTRRAQLIRRGLHGPVVPIAIGGAVLALLLVGAAGSYWADRRAREVRLLSSRGVGPGALAAKAALELTAPAVLGTVLGWGLAYELVRLLGPSGDIEPRTPLFAAATAGIGLLAGVLLLSVVAGLRARNATERPFGQRNTRAALLPWELLVLGVAALLYLRMRGETAVTLIDGVAQVNLLLVAFPLTFLLGAAVLLVRALGLGLPGLRRVSRGWPVAGYLAIRRITSAPLVSLILLAAASLPVAVLVYSGGLTATSRVTVDAKARLYAGAPVSLGTANPVRETPALRAVGTPVTRYVGGRLGRNDADVLAVDPATFARWAYWDDRFADRSLPELMRGLAVHRPDGRLPALLVRHRPSGGNTLHLGRTSRRLAVVAPVRALPGIRDNYSDLLVVDAAQLGRVDPTIDSQGEVWSRRSQAAVERVTTGQGQRTVYVTSPRGVVDATNFLAVSWTFGYLEALAALVGLIAVGGLLLYLATRQRARIASYALGRRMGLTRRRHLRSLVIELGVLLGAAYGVGLGLSWAATHLVYRRLDVDPTRAPGPLLTQPVAAYVGSAVVVVAVVLVSALVAQRTADSANPAEVMRVDV